MALPPARLEEWTTFHLRNADGSGGEIVVVSCPVCGATLVNSDTMAMARHALWHHNRGEWPWEEM